MCAVKIRDDDEGADPDALSSRILQVLVKGARPPL